MDNELVAGFNLKVDTDPSDGTNVSDYRTLEKPSPQEAGRRSGSSPLGIAVPHLRFVTAGSVCRTGALHLQERRARPVIYYEAERKLHIQFDVTR